jgi:hypothetical protein
MLDLFWEAGLVAPPLLFGRRLITPLTTPAAWTYPAKVMPESLIPPSSEELARWLRLARESRATIQRGVRGLDKAMAKIEDLVAKAPRDPEVKDAPARS